MATLKYLIGDNVDGADKYRLYKHDSATRPNTVNINNRIAEQSKLLDFQHYGAIDSNGENIGHTKPCSYIYEDQTGSGGSAFGRPLRKITEDGIRYYFKIGLYATLNYGSAITSKVWLDGEYYLQNDDPFKIRGNLNPSFEKAADGGWDLLLYIEPWVEPSTVTEGVIRVRVFGSDEYVKGVDFGKGQNTFEITLNELDTPYRHTEYIALNALGNDYSVNGIDDGVCVGPFDLSGSDYDYSKMSFYDKNLKHVGSANSDYLSKAYGKNERQFFTTEEIMAISWDVTGATPHQSNEEGYPIFVVFSSKESSTAEKDKVCVPFAYFPLFAMRDKFEQGNNYVYATADSQSDYFTESPASNVETYYVPES